MTDRDRVMREAVARMSVERKLEVAHGLRELAWQLKASVLRSEHPDWTEEQVQAGVRRIFLDAVR